VAAADARVQELSDLLQLLPLHPPELRGPKFRNPNGVYMKVQNFKAFDAYYEDRQRSGLIHGGRRDREATWRS
jgi:5-methylcytosine-specific restriction enzyme A